MPNSPQKTFSTEQKKMYSLVAVFILGLMAFMIWDHMHWWEIREDYSFGYLVPIFSIFLIYDRWPKIQEALLSQDPKHIASPSKSFISKTISIIVGCAFACGLITFAFGAFYRAAMGNALPASFFLAWGFAWITVSLVYLMGDQNPKGETFTASHRLKISSFFIFSAFIWLLSAPMFSALEKTVSTFLLNKVTVVVFSIFDLLGFPLEREGNVLILPKGRIGVAEACSGIRSLTGCLFSGSFLSAVFMTSAIRKGLLIASALILAIITNLFRSFFLTSWAYAYGSEALDAHWHLPLFGDIGSVHDVTGFLILIVTSILLICLVPIFNLGSPTQEQTKETSKDSGN